MENTLDQQHISAPQEISQEHTLEQIIQTKLPDQTQQTSFLSILNQPGIAQSFSPQELQQYLQGQDIQTLNMFIQGASLDEQLSFVIEDIDTYFAAHGGRKDIVTYIQTQSEELDNTQKQSTENTEQSTENTEQSMETLRQQELYEQFLKTKSSREALPDKQVISPEAKKLIPAETIQLISDKIDAVHQAVPGSTISLDDYLNFSATAQTLDPHNPQHTEFLHNFEALRSSLDIPSETMSFAQAHSAEMSTSLVETSPQLKSYAQTSKLITPLEDWEATPEQDALLIKFIPDQAVREQIIQGQEAIRQGQVLPDSQDYVHHLQTTQQALLPIKEALARIRSESQQTGVLSSCIRGLSGYFDSKAMDGEAMADKIAFHPQDDLEIMDDILHIKGDIAGQQLGFYYHLGDPQANLQSDDFLHFDRKSETYALGMDKGSRKDLGIHLPPLQHLSTQAGQVVDKHFDRLLSDTTSLQELRSGLTKTVGLGLERNFGQHALVKSRIAQDMQKNMTMQSLQSQFISPEANIHLSKRPINKLSHPHAYQLLRIWDSTSETMNGAQQEQLRTLSGKLQERLKSSYTHLEPKRQSLLADMRAEQLSVNYDATIYGSKTLKFFSAISHGNRINMVDFQRFISILEKDEPIAQHLDTFSPSFHAIWEEDEKVAADLELDQQLQEVH